MGQTISPCLINHLLAICAPSSRFYQEWWYYWLIINLDQRCWLLHLHGSDDQVSSHGIFEMTILNSMWGRCIFGLWMNRCQWPQWHAIWCIRYPLSQMKMKVITCYSFCLLMQWHDNQINQSKSYASAHLSSAALMMWASFSIGFAQFITIGIFIKSQRCSIQSCHLLWLTLRDWDSCLVISRWLHVVRQSEKQFPYVGDKIAPKLEIISWLQGHSLRSHYKSKMTQMLFITIIISSNRGMTELGSHLVQWAHWS